MEITLLQGILLAIFAFVFAVDFWLEGLFIFRPIIVCTVAGIILGDLQTGLLAGGLVELAFAGLTSVGGTVPPDPIMTSIMTVVISVTTGHNVATALGIALPFGLLMQYLGIFSYSIFSYFNPTADKYAKKGRVDDIVRLGILITTIYASYFLIVAFLSTYVMQDTMVSLVNAMPEFLIHGFQVAGGLVPAVGFAMLLNVMLKKRYIAYLLAGFLFVSFIPFDNILPVAVMGLAFALLNYYKTNENNGKGGEQNEGI
ncbi:MAG: PTS galactosamine transporter subunit IIC [Bacilli bacterium]|nr:PTS galactosamine transporter subunit IIC [Bacilli bacterium]